MWYSPLERILWATGLLGQVVLLFVLFRRRHTRRFPVFTSLIAFNIVENVWLFLLYRNGSALQQYVWYWRILSFGYLLEVAFIFELAFKILSSSGVVVKQAMKPFLALSALALLTAALFSHALSSKEITGWNLLDLRATYFATCLTCFLYLALLRAVNLWHLPWRGYVMSLGEGLAVWQITSTLMDSAHLWSGWRWADKIYDNVSSAALIGIEIFWIRALWFPERNLVREMRPESERFISTLAARLCSIRSVSPSGDEVPHDDDIYR